jgi:hypothetical protein
MTDTPAQPALQLVKNKPKLEKPKRDRDALRRRQQQTLRTWTDDGLIRRKP